MDAIAYLKKDVYKNTKSKKITYIYEKALEEIIHDYLPTEKDFLEFGELFFIAILKVLKTNLDIENNPDGILIRMRKFACVVDSPLL